jgi:hypothetical protein
MLPKIVATKLVIVSLKCTVCDMYVILLDFSLNGLTGAVHLVILLINDELFPLRYYN